MTFWLITLAITLVICFIGFYPLLKSKQQLNGTQRSTLNKHFYFQRLKEVEQEANEGVIEDAEQTKQELQQSLLDDIPEEAEQQASIQAVKKVLSITTNAIFFNGFIVSSFKSLS